MGYTDRSTDRWNAVVAWTTHIGRRRGLAVSCGALYLRPDSRPDFRPEASESSLDRFGDVFNKRLLLVANHAGDVEQAAGRWGRPAVAVDFCPG